MTLEKRLEDLERRLGDAAEAREWRSAVAIWRTDEEGNVSYESCGERLSAEELGSFDLVIMLPDNGR